MSDIDAREVEADVTSTVCLITSAHAARRNVMAATQVVLLSYDPPLVGVAITPSHYTYELISGSGEFGICIASASQLPLVRALGHSKGRDIDKFSSFAIETLPAQRIAAPLVAGCRAALECRVAQVVPTGDHRLVVGGVLVHHRYSSEPPLLLVEGRLD